MRLYAVIAGLLGLSTFLLYARPIAAQEASKPAPSQAPAANRDDREAAASAAAVALAGQLKLHPPEPSGAAVRVGGLYMIEIATGEVTLIADGADPDTTFCGSASWSSDGKRIFYDAMRPDRVAQSHLKVIELVAGELSKQDLGVGNCPSASPDGEEVAFLLNHGGVPGVQGGIWLMRSDGSQRRRLGGFGRPKWSPDGRQFMLTDFSIPANVRLMEKTTGRISSLRLKDREFWSAPNWVSDGTIVAVVGQGWGYTIALIDVTDPARAKVKEVLWEMNFKGKGIDANPHAPVYATSAQSLRVHRRTEGGDGALFVQAGPG